MADVVQVIKDCFMAIGVVYVAWLIVQSIFDR